MDMRREELPIQRATLLGNRRENERGGKTCEGDERDLHAAGIGRILLGSNPRLNGLLPHLA
jgi:hypothetical protein